LASYFIHIHNTDDTASKTDEAISSSKNHPEPGRT